MTQSFHMPDYGWDITVLYAIGKTGAKDAIERLGKAGCHGATLESARANLEKAAVDTGFTYSNYINRESVLVIHKASNVGEFINTLSHEKRHLEAHMCEALDINPYSEEAARLSGDISQILLEKALRSIIAL